MGLLILGPFFELYVTVHTMMCAFFLMLLYVMFQFRHFVKEKADHGGLSVTWWTELVLTDFSPSTKR